MSDMDHQDEFDKAFEGFGEDPKPATPPAEPPKDDPAQEDGGKDDTEPKDPKQDEQPKTEEPKKEEGQDNPVTTDAPKAEEDGKKPETPETPEDPKPLTREDVTSIISNIRTEERATTKELDTATNDVLEAYYPDGLSNTLVDQTTGKELRTPQDVVEATNGQMAIEEATKWLMNEQYKLDTEVARIKDDARKVAETTVNFKRDSVAVLQKYEPLFKWQPHLQEKAFKLLMGQVTADKEKGVILKAPDVVDLYDTYLEPYQQAYEFSKGQPATNPTPPPDASPEPPKPSADDRLDEGGDGGASPVDDLNDFAQQVKKELAKGL